MADPKINVLIGAKIDELVKALTDSESRLQKFGEKAKDLGAKLSLAVTAPITAFAALSVSNFDKQVQAIGQVEAAIKSTGGTAGFTSIQLQKIASDLQNISTFGDEEILQKSTAQLLTFTNIAGKQFEKTQKAALDLATRLGGDLQGATIQLGKALNDPVANLSALSRAGIQFSEAQKDLIDSLAETNRLAEAQDIILLELEKQFGGAAEAAASLGLGPLKQLQNQFGDLLEEFGKIIAEGIKPLIDNAKKLITFFQELPEGVKKVIVVISAFAAALGPLLFGIGSLITLAPVFVAGFAAVTGPIGLAVIAVGALAAGLAILATNTGLSEEAIKKQTIALDIYKTANNQLAEAQNLVNKANAEYGKVSEETTAKTKEAIKAKIEDVKATLLQAEAANKLAVAEAKKESLFDIIVGFERVQRRVAKVQKEGANQTAELTKQLNELTVSYLKIGTTVQETIKPVKQTFEEFSKLADIANEKFFRTLAEDADAYNKSLKETERITNKLAEASQKVASGISLQKIDTEVDISGFEPIEETADNPFTDAETKALAAQSSIKRAMESLEKELNDRIPTIEEKLRTFGLNVDDIIRNNIAGAFIDLGYTIGEALASGANVIESIGKSLLNSMGQFLGQLGEQLIAFGVAGLAFGKLSIGLTNPLTAIKSAPLAIAAGVALTAISGAIGSIGKRGLGGGGSFSTAGVSGGTTFSGQGATGLQFDRSLQLAGEFRVKGQDLVYVFNEASTKNQRG
jgi:hypothetical protein